MILDWQPKKIDEDAVLDRCPKCDGLPVGAEFGIAVDRIKAIRLVPCGHFVDDVWEHIYGVADDPESYVVRAHWFHPPKQVLHPSDPEPGRCMATFD